MLIERGYRPADYQNQIARRWKKLVMPQDVIYHLGDTIMSRQSDLANIVNGLPGIKILIRGNHDRETDSWYMNRGFSFVAMGVLTEGVWLTHQPQSTLPIGAIINVHGHLHGDNHRSSSAYLPQHCKLLALEIDGYGPVAFDDFCGLPKEAQKLLR